ncbi:MAG: bacteriohemerythrin [Pseudomonadales bacterium]|nr:bacteriohemerythrin [Pseudomonadales bacterium]
MYIEWKKEYCVGVARIDEQHQQLIKLLNALYKEVSGGAPASQSWGLLDKFSDYAETHFTTEERIAVDGGVPSGQLESHKAEHDAYRVRVKSFYASMSKDKTVPVQLMAFLSKWWLSHILVLDMELGRVINEQ